MPGKLRAAGGRPENAQSRSAYKTDGATSSGSGPWFRLLHSNTRRIVASSGLKGLAVFVGAAVYADAQGRCFPSIRTIAGRAGYRHPRAVAARLKELTSCGAIDRQRRRRRSTLTTIARNDGARDFTKVTKSWLDEHSTLTPAARGLYFALLAVANGRHTFRSTRCALSRQFGISLRQLVRLCSQLEDAALISTANHGVCGLRWSIAANEELCHKRHVWARGVVPKNTLEVNNFEPQEDQDQNNTRDTPRNGGRPEFSVLPQPDFLPLRELAERFEIPRNRVTAGLLRTLAALVRKEETTSGSFLGAAAVSLRKAAREVGSSKRREKILFAACAAYLGIDHLTGLPLQDSLSGNL